MLLRFQRFVPLLSALCLLPFICCLGSSAFQGEAVAARADGNQMPGVVQLLAVGPGSGDKNRECSATGFLVNAAGYLLTNAHVVDEARHCLERSGQGKIVAKFPGSGSRAEAVSCDLVAMDEAHDIAVLKLERLPVAEKSLGFVPLDAREVGEGTPVAVTGHSASTWHAATERGRVIGHARLALDESTSEKTEVLILGVRLRGGASGSPVCLPSGAAIGVVSRQNPARPAETVAIPIRYFIDLLNRLSVRWQPPD